MLVGGSVASVNSSSFTRNFAVPFADSTRNESPATVTRRCVDATSGSSIRTSLPAALPTVIVVFSPKSRRAMVARYDVGEVFSHCRVSSRSFSIARVSESVSAAVSRTGGDGAPPRPGATARSAMTGSRATRFMSGIIGKPMGAHDTPSPRPCAIRKGVPPLVFRRPRAPFLAPRLICAHHLPIIRPRPRPSL
jgi:hypothetical protein